ncbi:DUF4357 domain-containing protein [Sinimarinibacterium sp. CAU 1509]|uniref:DUF4357 domain-containing protein n=1 Tax=Sinimarinibacterium sp. CAU 1509 TaxID=2562283 RepID=UPI0010ACA834|nr:DUF4357 domain-containing protein [Sinimarinibacterium sp. CAU 1509]TJY59430.1 DUF4357 domain-containing protein [Sinimarinibacterium sp. CAU 1509]
MSSTLTAHEQPLSKIFSDDYVFSIPGYQRPYSWTTEQARELIDDLHGFMKSSDKALGDIPPYFLGSIVLIKQESQPPTTVVDGQQRLTTLTLLLSAIRAKTADDKAKSGLSRLIYEQGDVILNTENHYRLTLRERDRDFFREYVQHDGGIDQLIVLSKDLPDSQNNLRENARLFMNRLDELNEGERVKLAQFIATRCYLVTVCTPDLDSAYRIFNVLNSRGLDLSATDILKAEIVGKIGAGKRDHYTEVWENIEDDLGREDFGNLFSHIRMIHRKAKPQGTVLKEFREHVVYASPEAFMDGVLAPLAAAYEEITDAAYTSPKDAEAVNTHLYWLNRIEFKDWMPAALVFMSRHRNDHDRMVAFFRDLERLVYSMLIGRWGINERIERCSALTKAIESGQDLWAPGSPLLLTDIERGATYQALNGPLYSTHSARALSLLLLRLDALLSGGGATYNYNVVTVEHVLPQNPQAGSTWLDWFPDEEIRQQWVHRLGNLALLTRKKNSSASNYDFDRKKNSYFAKGGVSPFAMTTQVLAGDHWDLETVEKWQSERLAILEKHWALEDRVMPVSGPQVSSGPRERAELIDIDRLFFCKASGADATARCTAEGLWVLKGSTGRSETTESLKEHTYRDIRSTLLKQGVIVDSGDGRIRFEQDFLFKRPSAAAVAVTGRAANGWTEWKDAEGMSLREACGLGPSEGTE